MVDYLKIASLTEFNDCRNNTYIQHLGETYGQSPSVNINNVEFTSDMDFSYLYHKELFFNNCIGIDITLNGKASFKNCKFKQIDATQIKLGNHSSELKKCTVETIKVGLITSLNECVITNLLINDTGKHESKEVRLSNSSSIDDLNILNCDFNLNIEGKSDIILRKVRINNIQNKYLPFEGIKIHEIEILNISHNNPQALDVTLKDIPMLEKITVRNSNLSAMTIDTCTVSKFLFDNTKPCNSLRVFNSKITDFILKNHQITELTCTGKVSIDNLIWSLAYSKINKWIIQPLNPNNSKIKNFICINGTIPSDAEVNFSNIVIDSIVFWNVSNLGKFVFSGITGEKVLDSNDSVNHIDSVIKKYKEDHIIPESLNWNWGAIPQNAFYIINSDLGKAIFYNCTFKSMNLFMVGAKINEINISDSEWPQKLYSPSEDITTNLPRQYAQLRKIHETVGDTVKAGMYQAEELNAFHQSLKSIKGHRAEKFNLWLNKYTNYFGQDYVRAFGVTFGVSLVLYFFYCRSLGFYLDYNSDESLDNFWNIAANFLEFINPIHKADYIASILLDVKEDQLKPYKLARLIDILSRMLNGYFIYQFIQAFRKYGKR